MIRQAFEYILFLIMTAIVITIIAYFTQQQNRDGDDYYE
jgi:hypothetical protein